jgi:hypothetical protein
VRQMGPTSIYIINILRRVGVLNLKLSYYIKLCLYCVNIDYSMSRALDLTSPSPSYLRMMYTEAVYLVFANRSQSR